MPANREYKDRLFKFIFANPDHREWALSLYNAVNGRDYQDAQEIQYTTIEDAVYMSMRNDVSLLVDGVMSMYEQQSTPNPNLPMRYLIYAGMVYARYTETSEDYHRYSRRQQKAPTPKCVCFYNGTEELDDVVELQLRDAFEGGMEPDIDVRVLVLNINDGRNRDLLNACAPLNEYAWFVDHVREYQRESRNLEKAIDRALAEMPEDMALRAFLLTNRAEVKSMCITEYDEARTFAEQRSEGFEEGHSEGYKTGKDEGYATGLDEGREAGRKAGLKEGRVEGRKEGLKEGRKAGLKEGRVEGRIDILVDLVHEGLLSEELAAARSGLSLDELRSRL